MSDLVKKISDKLREKGWMMVTAESCTGGMIAMTMTDQPGSSEIFDRGFVTYSNISKEQMLDVDPYAIKNHGAVSPKVAESMASGALKFSRANLSISVTGIAGPDGGTEQKPVGLVYIGYGLKGGIVQSKQFQFDGSRDEIRIKATHAALKQALAILEKAQ